MGKLEKMKHWLSGSERGEDEERAKVVSQWLKDWKVLRRYHGKGNQVLSHALDYPGGTMTSWRQQRISAKRESCRNQFTFSFRWKNGTGEYRRWDMCIWVMDLRHFLSERILYIFGLWCGNWEYRDQKMMGNICLVTKTVCFKLPRIPPSSTKARRDHRHPRGNWQNDSVAVSVNSLPTRHSTRVRFHQSPNDFANDWDSWQP